MQICLCVDEATRSLYIQTYTHTHTHTLTHTHTHTHTQTSKHMQMAEKRRLAASDTDKPLNLRKNSAQKSAESAVLAREAADRAQVCVAECVAVWQSVLLCVAMYICQEISHKKHGKCGVVA